MNLFQEAKQVLDKDGKVNPLGPYGKQKLTGREVTTYFRRNKVADAMVKKAVEVALDLGGAMDVAAKEIKKFYGDKVLKSKEVQNALKYANEEVVTEADAEEKAKVALKHAKEMEAIKRKHAQEKERVSEGKGSDIFKKYGSIINRLSDKEKDEVIELLYTMNTQSGRRYKEAFGKVKELLNMEYIPEDSDMAINPKTVNKTKPMLMKHAKKFGVDLEFGIGGKMPSVLQIKSKSSQAEKGFLDAVGKDKQLMKLIDHVEHDINENYRTAARHGMGTEGKKEARVGLELDYYDSNGNKHMGKIVKKDSKGYTVKDDKTGKMHTFVYHDRIKARKFLQKMGDNLGEGTMAIGIKDRDPKERVKAKKKLSDMLKKDGNKKVGSKEGQKFDEVLDTYILSDDELADEFANPKNKNMKVIDLLKKHSKRLNVNFAESVEEGANPAQQAAIAISKKEKAGKPGYDKEGKSLKKESVMDTYRQMWEDGQKYAPDLVEVTDKEINAMKQLSKDAEKIKKGFQKITKMGDRELQNGKYNKEYEDILKMSQSVLSLIGKLSNQKMINKESLEEKLSKADLKMIDMMYDKKGNLTDVGKAVMNYKPGDNIRKIVQNLNNKK